MAGTRTTPPPMPRRPTSTPAPSPRRRMMNVIVIGWLCAYRLDDSNQISSIFYLPPSGLPAATGVDERQRQEIRLFLFARNLLYLLVFVTSVPRPAGGCAADRRRVSQKKRIPSP